MSTNLGRIPGFFGVSPPKTEHQEPEGFCDQPSGTPLVRYTGRLDRFSQAAPRRGHTGRGRTAHRMAAV